MASDKNKERLVSSRLPVLDKVAKEGNLKIFLHRGYVCVVLRPSQMRWQMEGKDLDDAIFLCGYVGVPKGHPFYGWNYNFQSPSPPCHGGITYTDDNLVSGSNLWFMGFDCAHSGDLTSLFKFDNKKMYGCVETYKDMDFATKQVKKLAEWFRRQELKKRGNDAKRNGNKG